MYDIETLDKQYKATSAKSIKRELEMKINNFKIMDASQAAKEIMYVRQQFLDYRLFVGRGQGKTNDSRHYDIER